MSMRVLDELVKLIRSELNLEISDPDKKESHQGKKLSRHVEECRELSSFIVNTFGMGDEAERFSSLLCEVHDIGKLLPEWHFGVRGFRHSEKGAELLENSRGLLRRFLRLDDTSMELLIFMVRKHHSSLRFYSYKEYRKLKMDFDRALLYADSFGAFKLADFASANNLIEEIRDHLSRDWVDESSILSYLTRKDDEKLKKQQEIASAGDIMLSAPTGWGKTMVGLLRAVRDRPIKLFYCLPTITAIRKMKEGFENCFRESVGEYFYFVDFDLLREIGEEDGFELEMYRFFVPKINITTVDQLLLSMMRAGKYHMRRFQFRNSLVVIDEYHLLPPSMIGALIEVLSRYSKPYGMKLLLMTATPLGAYRKALKSSLGLREVDLSEEYSRLRRHRIELIKREEALNKVEEVLREGKRVLVISNTVDRAREFYRKLETEGKLLLHSRFAVKDRYDKELKIDSCRILVATQVAEVSLDVSFDVLISDVAPIPSLIQRAGRVNRYAKETEGTNVYIIEDLESPEPYTKVEIDKSLETIRSRAEDLERKGEIAYLSMLADYDDMIRYYLNGEISKFRNLVAEKVFEEDQLTSMDLNDEKFSEIFRGETNILVVPEVYLEEVRYLTSRLKETGSYQERKRIYSELKGYLAPLSVNLAKYAEFIEGMQFPVVKYDEELGIICPKNT